MIHLENNKQINILGYIKIHISEINYKGENTMINYIHRSKYFNGNEISQYGLEHGYIDYGTLAKGFDAVLNNNIINNTDDWEVVNGSEYEDEYVDEYEEEYEDEYEEEYEDEKQYKEIYQYYIISESGYQTLSNCTNELVYYSEELDIYLWAIDHFGTGWDYVLTGIKIELQ